MKYKLLITMNVINILILMKQLFKNIIFNNIINDQITSLNY